MYVLCSKNLSHNGYSGCTWRLACTCFAQKISHLMHKLFEVIISFKPEVERDEFCQKILRARMQDGCLKPAPIAGDIKTFKPKGAALQSETMTAGFPCQAGPTYFSKHKLQIQSNFFESMREGAQRSRQPSWNV